MNKNKNYFDLSLDEKKEIFTKNLVSTNRGFNFYVDWKNAQAYKDFEIELNTLNILINVVDNDEFKLKFQTLLKKLPSVVKTFPLLFALSKKERENIWKGKDILQVLEDVNLDKNALEYDFDSTTILVGNNVEKYYEFFEKIGLKFLFQNLLEKNILDYVIGVLVGLDSNGRKNRGGKSFELACEPIIQRLCKKYDIELLVQKQFKFLNEKYKIIIDDNIANRKADFILIKDNKAINIEANFYFDSGSKPEEIIDSYSNRQYELKKNNIEFIYLTDGIKCWGNIDKNQLAVIDSVFRESGEETNFAREEIVKERDIARQQKNAKENWFMNVSLNHPFNYDPAKSYVGVIKDTSSSTVIEKITENRLQNGSISTKINDIFDTFSTARAEVGASSRRAQENETASQDILLTLEENVSDIRDADLASLLTQLEFLMTNKEAAQATFTRITSKSLFDFLG
jgi:flagellin-like hook-associated protein FlgL